MAEDFEYGTHLVMVGPQADNSQMEKGVAQTDTGCNFLERDAFNHS
jgi:hypothetical protein